MVALLKRKSKVASMIAAQFAVRSSSPMRFLLEKSPRGMKANVSLSYRLSF